MRSTKTLLAAASVAILTTAGIGAASAQPWDHHPAPIARHDVRHDMNRRVVDRDRVWVTLREHHLRGMGNPYFVRGHYVVPVAGRTHHPLLIEVNPYTGAFIGEFRI